MSKHDRYDDYMSTILNLNHPASDIFNKRAAENAYVRYMLARTQCMFKYENLPSTIPQRQFELILQTNGWISVFQATDRKTGALGLFASFGGLSGAPNPYYLPTEFVLANPALSGPNNYKINDECVVIPNDSTYQGLTPMLSRYAKLIAENEVSIGVAEVNARLISLITAEDDVQKAAAEKLIKDIYDGKLSVVGNVNVFEGLKTLPYSSSGQNNNLTQLIEMQQFLKASCFNELGINSNYNMKRESINASEAQMGEDALIPLALDMLHCREEGVAQVNKMFGTAIQVKLASVWENNVLENDIMAENVENSFDNVENSMRNGEYDETKQDDRI